MHQNRILYFIQRSFRDLKGTFLVSTCLAAVILLVLVLLREQETQIVDCTQESIAYELNLIAPAQLGINEWNIGDYAHYRHRRKESPTSKNLLFDREVGFQIIGKLNTSDSHGYWMKKTGFFYFRSIPEEVYCYLTLNDMRITQQNRIYKFTQNYFPFRLKFCDQSATPLAKLTELSEETIETEAGIFQCTHYQVELGSNRNYMEIWASSSLPPLGIVRAQSQTDILELKSFGREREVVIPEMMQPVIAGVSALDYGCNSCHGYDNCHEMFSPPK